MAVHILQIIYRNLPFTLAIIKNDKLQIILALQGQSETSPQTEDPQRDWGCGRGVLWLFSEVKRTNGRLQEQTLLIVVGYITLSSSGGLHRERETEGNVDSGLLYSSMHFQK